MVMGKQKSEAIITSSFKSAAQLLGIKFLDHLILGSSDSEDGRGFVLAMEGLASVI